MKQETRIQPMGQDEWFVITRTGTSQFSKPCRMICWHESTLDSWEAWLARTGAPGDHVAITAATNAGATRFLYAYELGDNRRQVLAKNDILEPWPGPYAV